MIPEGEKNSLTPSWTNKLSAPRFTVCVTNTIDKTDYIIADVEVLVLASVGKGSDDHLIYRRAVSNYFAEIRQSVKFGFDLQYFQNPWISGSTSDKQLLLMFVLFLRENQQNSV